MLKRPRILLGGVISVVLVVLFIGTSVAKNPVSTSTFTATSTDIPTVWKQYASEGIGVTFRYPPTYTVSEAEGVIEIRHDPLLIPNLVLTREKDLLRSVWSLQAHEVHRESRKDPTAQSFIVTSFTTGEPSIVRQYILMPKDFPKDLGDTEENTKGLRITFLGGDSFDKGETLTSTLEKIVFSIEDIR
jgi:hypothetical protein